MSIARLRRPRPDRGSSLIEVLIALAIMTLLMVGILQMFSVALVVNSGAGARTVLLFKCQQVVENLRYYYFLTKNKFTTPDGDGGTDPGGGVFTGIPFPLCQPPSDCVPATQHVYPIPYTDSDAPRWGYWGPDGAAVMEIPNGPYRISYTITQGPPCTAPPGPSACGVYVVTVTAIPAAASDNPSTQFFGVGLSRLNPDNALVNPKRVDYVAQLD